MFLFSFSQIQVDKGWWSTGQFEYVDDIQGSIPF